MKSNEQTFDIGDRVVIAGTPGEVVGWVGSDPCTPYLYDIRLDDGSLIDDIDPKQWVGKLKKEAAK